MRPYLLQRRSSGQAARGPRFRPLVESLESRIVPSIIDHSGGFASHGDLTFNGSAVVQSSAAQLTNGTNQAGSFFSNSKVEDSQFVIEFTFQTSGATGGGLTLTFNNDATGAAALGGHGTAMGFTGLKSSLAFFFDPGSNSTGLLISGVPSTSVSMQGINLQSQDMFHVTLNNDGSTIKETIVDVATGTTFSHSFNVIIQQQIGSHTAFVGFTGATGAHTATESIHTFAGHFGSAESPSLTASGVGTINGVEGQLLHYVTLATFTGPSSSAGCTASVDWGDGTTSMGFITGPDQNGVFTVHGTHTYVEEGKDVHGGPFTITVTITCGTSTATATDSTDIAEAPISATGGFTIPAVEGQSFTATVATFVDTGGPEDPTDPGDYTATIDWGDGSTSNGTITLSNGVFTVTGSHTYPEDGENESDLVDTFTVTTTIIHETVSATATSTVNLTEEPGIISASGVGNISAVEGQSFTTAVATFTGTASKAVINWGDGTTSLGTISGPNNSGVFTVFGTHSYVEESNSIHGGNPFTITVTLYNSTNVSVTSTATVAEAPLSATGGFKIQAVEGQSFTATVATFIDTGGPEDPNDPGDYTAAINWGDGTTSTGKITLSNGVFTVTGSHTYAEDGENESDAVDTFSVSTTIVHETVSASATSTVYLSEEPGPSPGPGVTLNGVEGQTFSNVVVATFTDGSEPASDFTATISWGDGTTSQGSVSGPNSNGVFTVVGSHTYVEESKDAHGGNPFTITVNVHDQINITITSQANIAEAPLSATGGFKIQAVEGQSFTATVATFVDTGGPEDPNNSGDYTAAINWGDGTTSTGKITLSNGVFTVTGSHTYAEDGENESDVVDTFSVSTTIVHETVSASATSTVNLSEESGPSPGPGVVLNGVEGQTFSNVVVATFTDGSEPASDFTATISWGDGTTSQGSVSGPNSNGVFTVVGSHTYVEESKDAHGGNPFTITVNVHDQINITITSQANIAEAPLTATGGLTINAVEGQSVTATVATFIDTGGPEDPNNPGDYTATINWGDNTTSTGTISLSNGVFSVSGSHAYTEESNAFHGSSFTITVNIVHEAVSASATSTAVLAEAPLTATGGLTISGVEGQAFTAAVATFVDTGGPEDPNNPGDYSATIDWGDGTTSTGAITLSNQTFTVSGSHTYGGTGTFTIGVAITHETVSASATSTAVISADAPSVTGGLTLAAVEGQAFTGTVATFTDGHAPASAFTAAIDWGDGTTSTGTISGPDKNGVFSVTGSHTYLEESGPATGGPFSLTVTVRNNELVRATDTMNVADAPLLANSGAPVAAVEGQSFTSTVATFSDTGGPENGTQDYSATIDWGNGVTTAGVIAGPDQNGVFSVVGTQAYTEAGSYVISVTLNHDSAPAVTVTEGAIVGDAPLSAASTAVNATQGIGFAGVVATFTDTNPNPNLNDFSATITWGDGNSSAGAVSQNADGSFSVSGGNTYQSGGPFTISVVIADVGGFTATATSTASVAPADLPLTATGLGITGTPFQGQDQTVASFLDSDPTAVVGNFVATIDWGDGTQLATGTVSQPGGPGTPFFVDSIHAYNNIGTFTVHVHITDVGGLSDNGGAFADVLGTATVVGGGGASLPSQGLTGANGLQTLQASPVQQATPVPVTMAHTPGSSTPSTASNDLYWALYASRADRLNSLSSWSEDFSVAAQGVSP